MFLKGLKVIDASTVLAGPSVASFFAELGADVLKVENPANPDVTRSWKLPVEDPKTPVSAYFASVNYKKRYRSVDLKSGEGHAAFCALVREADMLITNFKYGDASRLKLEDADLFAINPQLIIGKINGFGTDSQRVAYDLILQAEAGYMSMNGMPESGPVKMPVALIDVLAAHQLKEALLLALIRKEREGQQFRGVSVSVSLFEAALTALVNQASNYLMTGSVPKRLGSLHPNIAPYGELFQTNDDAEITFAIGSDLHFERLCKILGLPQLLSDERFMHNQQRVQNRRELRECLEKTIRDWNSEDLLEKLVAQNVPAGKIRSLDEVFSNPAASRLVISEEIDGQETRRVSQIAFRWE